MSVSAISGSNLMQYNTQCVQNAAQLFRQEFQQLGEDLKSGSLSSAQQDYAKIQQSVQDFRAHKHGHGHRVGNYQAVSDLSQLLQQLGQALQSGNLTTAQTAYAAMQQEFQQLRTGNSLLAARTQSSSNVSVNA